MSLTSSVKTYNFAKTFAIALGYVSEETTEVGPPIKPTQEKKTYVGPSRVFSTTDYGKFESLNKEIEDEVSPSANVKKSTESKNNFCSHDHSKEISIFEKSTVEKLRAAEQFKKEGNEASACGNYSYAAYCYRKALVYFDYTFPETDEEWVEFNSLKLKCHLNMCFCKLREENWEEVEVESRQALEIDPRNVKALYRRGMGFMHIGDYSDAKQIFLTAIEIEPQNDEVRHALNLLNQKQSSYANKSKIVSATMIGCNKKS
eukprot:GHVL01007199.1.p1 GENE.GHVL01007199.1~~GHVL01007199.1.p1  ORF type:complete len:260 (+),score=54.62 GHVL01007199.1:108-887(+)